MSAPPPSAPMSSAPKPDPKPDPNSAPQPLAAPSSAPPPERGPGPLPCVTCWRIHIGAHKTATTHVQEILALMRPQLVERGIDFIPNRVVRQSGLAKALFRRRLATRVPGLRGRIVGQMMADHLDPLRAATSALVLSEEKLMGGSLQVFSDPIYPHVERIVPLLASLAGRAGGGADVTLFLSVRSFDGQMPSAYVQELKFAPPLEGGFEALMARVLARPPSWFDLVRRIRAAAPGVPLRVWRQEDYRREPLAILAELCGRDPGPLPAIEDPFWTKSPDLAAVRAAEALPAGMPPAERRAAVLEIFRTSGDGARFDPFAPEEKALLCAAYARDLERIAELDPGLLIRV
jgi:hypothetical protein